MVAATGRWLALGVFAWVHMAMPGSGMCGMRGEYPDPYGSCAINIVRLGTTLPFSTNGVRLTIVVPGRGQNDKPCGLGKNGRHLTDEEDPRWDNRPTVYHPK
jgi:hypothetical protein